MQARVVAVVKQCCGERKISEVELTDLVTGTWWQVMRRRSGISPTEVPSRSQRVDRGVLKGDGKLEKSVSREKEAHWSCQGRRGLQHMTEGWPAGVSPSHLDQSTHGFLLCCYVCASSTSYVIVQLLTFQAVNSLYVGMMLSTQILHNEIISNKKIKLYNFISKRAFTHFFFLKHWIMPGKRDLLLFLHTYMLF